MPLDVSGIGRRHRENVSELQLLRRRGKNNLQNEKFGCKITFIERDLAEELSTEEPPTEEQVAALFSPLDEQTLASSIVLHYVQMLVAQIVVHRTLTNGAQ